MDNVQNINIHNWNSPSSEFSDILKTAYFFLILNGEVRAIYVNVKHFSTEIKVYCSPCTRTVYKAPLCNITEPCNKFNNYTNLNTITSQSVTKCNVEQEFELFSQVHEAPSF
jgi:hypothetical protein